MLCFLLVSRLRGSGHQSRRSRKAMLTSSGPCGGKPHLPAAAAGDFVTALWGHTAAWHLCRVSACAFDFSVQKDDHILFWFRVLSAAAQHGFLPRTCGLSQCLPRGAQEHSWWPLDWTRAHLFLLHAPSPSLPLSPYLSGEQFKMQTEPSQQQSKNPIQHWR